VDGSREKSLICVFVCGSAPDLDFDLSFQASVLPQDDSAGDQFIGGWEWEERRRKRRMDGGGV